MSLVYARIQLANDLRSDLMPVELDARVDLGALTLCIPQEIAAQLDLAVRDRRFVELADGSTCEVDMVAPVAVTFGNRFTVTAAVVGGEVLFGRLAMQDLDVLIDPRTERLIIPPERPNFALTKIKSSVHLPAPDPTPAARDRPPAPSPAC